MGPLNTGFECLIELLSLEHSTLTPFSTKKFAFTHSFNQDEPIYLVGYRSSMGHVSNPILLLSNESSEEKEKLYLETLLDFYETA